MQKQTQQEATFNSIFVPEIKIDISNYITELLIKNYVEFTRVPMPTSPFWRKEIAKNSKELTELSKRYVIELGGVKQLLKIFKPEAIIKAIANNKQFSYKLLKKHNQAKFIYDVFHQAIKDEKSGSINLEAEIKIEKFTPVNYNKQDNSIFSL